ncbi:MAG: hypothetical protein ACK4Q5_13415 [Saprospiraceae bacterium]
MKNTLLAFLLMLAAPLSEGCQKEDEAEELFGGDENQYLPECYRNSDFGCTGIVSDQYFSCLLDGQEFCLNAGVDGYTVQMAEKLIVVTDGPTLNPITAKGRYCLEISLQHESEVEESAPRIVLQYISPSRTSPQFILDNVFKEGPLKLRDISNPADSVDCFDAWIAFSCSTRNEFGTYTDIRFETDDNAQPGSYLNCTSYERTETDTQITYDFTLELKCKLYQGANRVWRNLTDGRFKGRVVLDK